MIQKEMAPTPRIGAGANKHGASNIIVHPQTIKVNWASIPQGMRALDQWVLWRYKGEPDPKTGKRSKAPYQINGSMASSTNNATWSSFDEVQDVYETGGYDGIGFVFSDHDDFCGVDLDSSVVNGVIRPEHEQIIREFNSYTEVTPSGKGYHIIGYYRGKFPGMNNGPAGVEVYSTGRFFTVTGDEFSLDGTTGRRVRDCQLEVEALRAKYATSTGAAGRDSAGDWAGGGVSGACGTAGPAGAAGGRVLANHTLFGLPDDLIATIEGGAPVGERSEVMFSVYNRLLAAGYSVENIIAVFKAYPKGIGEKFATEWKSNEQALRKDIDRALSSLVVPPQVSALLERFALLVDGEKVVDLQAHPSHAVQKLREFHTNYANSFVLVPDGTRVKQVPATTLWTRHPARKTVRAEAFDPRYGRIFQRRGETFYNKFMFIHADGGVDGLGTMNTTERDQLARQVIEHAYWLFSGRTGEIDLIFDWLAFLVQRPELRPKWCPLLLGPQGVGKDCLMFDIPNAFLGPGMVKRDTVKNMAGIGNSSGWNDSLLGTKLVVISETSDNGRQRYEINDSIRSQLIDSPLDMNVKYGAKGTIDVFAGVSLLTNNRDCLVIPEEDRRIWPVELFRTKEEGQARAEWFNHFYNADDGFIKNEKAHRAVFEWLKARKIGANISGHAPSSTLKAQMIINSKSILQRAVEEAVDNLKQKYGSIVRPGELKDETNRVIKEIDDLGSTSWVGPQNNQYKIIKAQVSSVIHGGQLVKCPDGEPRRLIAIDDRDVLGSCSPKELTKWLEKRWPGATGEEEIFLV